MYPGSKVLVYDSLAFINDDLTPLGSLMKPATIVNRYGIIKSALGCRYPDLVDVIFDERPHEISHGHLTDRIKEQQKDV